MLSQKSTCCCSNLENLQKIPALLSVYDALMLSSDIRTAFVQVLLDSDKDQSHFAEVNMKEALPV